MPIEKMTTEEMRAWLAMANPVIDRLAADRADRSPGFVGLDQLRERKVAILEAIRYRAGM